MKAIAQLHMLGKVLKRVMTIQMFLKETDYLDSLQLGFRPELGTESSLAALMEGGRGGATLFLLFDLSAALNTNTHGILLGWLCELAVGSTVVLLLPKGLY